MPTRLDDLITVRKVLPEDWVTALRSRCENIPWRPVSSGDRCTFDLSEADALCQRVMADYLEQLDELARRMVIAGVQGVNGGWTGQAKLSRYSAPSEGYPWHADQWLKRPDRDWRRVLSSVTWLNDDYEGGETEFLNGRVVTPQVGQTLTFPTSWMNAHQGRPVLDGTKYLLVIHIWS